MHPPSLSVLLAGVILCAFAGPAIAQDAPVPPGGTDLTASTKSREQAYHDASAAFARDDSETVIRLGRVICDGPVRDEILAWTLYMVSVAEQRREQWEACVRDSGRYLDEMRQRRHPERGYTVFVQGARGESLLALGRLAEAREVFRQILREHPQGAPGFEARGSLAALRFAGKSAVDPEYAGRYVGDPRLAEGVQRLEALLPSARTRLRSRLGAHDLEIPEVVFVLVDGVDSASEENFAMATRVLRRGDAKVPVILVRTEPLVGGCLDVELSMVHELTHVLHLLGGVDPDRSVHWIWEGMAEWVSDPDGRELRDMVLAASLRMGPDDERRTPLSTILGRESSIGTADREAQYVCGALLWYHLERQVGPERLRHLVLRLLREPKARLVLLEETQWSLDRHLTDLAKWYQEWVLSEFPGKDQFRIAARKATDGDPAGALALIDAFLRGHAGSRLVPYAQATRVALLQQSGDKVRALAACRSFREAHPFHPLAPGSWDRELGLLVELENWKEALPLARRLLLDEGWESEESAQRFRAVIAQCEEHLRGE